MAVDGYDIFIQKSTPMSVTRNRKYCSGEVVHSAALMAESRNMWSLMTKARAASYAT